jgi:hypothetical protein
MKLQQQKSNLTENYKIDTLFQIEKELYLTAEESLFVG